MPPVTLASSAVQPSPAADFASVDFGSKGHEGTWPGVYILGAQKSATTSLFITLANHGLICGKSGHASASTAAKEAHFFDDNFDDTFKNHKLISESKLHEYLKSYPHGECSGKYVDATPAYLRDIEVPSRMSGVMPHSTIHSTKLIAILREPISRDLSYYNMFKYMWVQQGKPSHKVHDMGDISELALCGHFSGFPSYANSIGCQMKLWNKCMECKNECSAEENVEAHKKCAYRNSDITKSYSRVTDGMYYAQLEKYENVFPRHHIMVMSFDGLINNEAHYLHKTVKFMGLNEKHAPSTLPEDNKSEFKGKVSKPACSTAANLHDVYSWWNKELRKKLKKDHEDGRAPAEEPEFVAFKAPECGGDEEAGAEDYVDLGAN